MAVQASDTVASFEGRRLVWTGWRRQPLTLVSIIGSLWQTAEHRMTADFQNWIKNRVLAASHFVTATYSTSPPLALGSTFRLSR